MLRGRWKSTEPSKETRTAAILPGSKFVFLILLGQRARKVYSSCLACKSEGRSHGVLFCQYCPTNRYQCVAMNIDHLDCVHHKEDYSPLYLVEITANQHVLSRRWSEDAEIACAQDLCTHRNVIHYNRCTYSRQHVCLALV